MEVKKQKEQSAPAKKQTIKTKKVWLSSYAIIALACIILYFLIRMQVFDIIGNYRNIVEKVSLAGFFAVVVLTVSKLIEVIILKKAHTKAGRYNLIRLTKLVSTLVIGFLFVSFLFANWYAAAVSLGLFSLIIGFALQTPISSFIGWMYIIIRNPYRIGDRIQLDTFKGDVIEVGYLDTTLWEFAGDYLTNDLPSGRLIRFPNSLVFQSPVYNYSWRDFQFIWNEIPFHVAYESNLDHVEKTLKEITMKELGPDMSERIAQLRSMIKESPIDDRN